MTDPVFSGVKQLLATSELPHLGPGPRTGVRSQGELEDSLEKLLSGSTLAPDRRALVRSLVLLWHDHLDAAHAIAQSIENRDGGFVHAIMHRRELDYGNAKYWFHRVPGHPAFPKIAARVALWLEEKGEGRRRQELVPKGQWDPFAFVDACEAESWKKGSVSDEESLREIQRIEIVSLLEHLFYT
jgi:hypothetical protein